MPAIVTDTLSKVHFTTIRNEIEGRFFSPEEGRKLKEAIDERTFVDPELRAAAADCWEPKK